MTKLTTVIKMLTFIWPNLLQGLNDDRKDSWMESFVILPSP